jgi:hypothetical protein
MFQLYGTFCQLMEVVCSLTNTAMNMLHFIEVKETSVSQNILRFFVNCILFLKPYSFEGLFTICYKGNNVKGKPG